MAEAVLALLDAGGVTKVVVLKRIWSDLGTDPAFVAMFHDEARLASVACGPAGHARPAANLASFL